MKDDEKGLEEPVLPPPPETWRNKGEDWQIAYGHSGGIYATPVNGGPAADGFAFTDFEVIKHLGFEPVASVEEPGEPGLEDPDLDLDL